VAVLGRDVAGVVAAVGPGVSGFKPGDDVYGTSGSGSYAEFATVPQRRLARKPANLSYEQAAAVPVSAQTALQAVRLGRVRAGLRVLVIGAGGGVGSFAVQIAKAHGATVTGVCGPTKVDLVRSLGADEVIDYTRAEVDAEGARYDVVLDIAGERPLAQLRRALRPQGTLVLVGGTYHKGGLLAGFGWQIIRGTLVTLFVRQRIRLLTARERAEDLDELRRLIEEGALTPAIARTYPLAEAPEAIRDLRSGHLGGKLVMTV
jgi:NADPH:quinone reductase-like Zn-dependent oxidoreductase